MDWIFQDGGSYRAASQLLHGVIDLAFKRAEGWTLIDYKSGQLAAGYQDRAHSWQ
jgi:ATP-dependent exoDNAse (exonuclease V) beta subunit